MLLVSDCWEERAEPLGDRGSWEIPGGERIEILFARTRTCRKDFRIEPGAAPRQTPVRPTQLTGAELWRVCSPPDLAQRFVDWRGSDALSSSAA